MDISFLVVDASGIKSANTLLKIIYQSAVDILLINKLDSSMYRVIEQSNIFPCRYHKPNALTGGDALLSSFPIEPIYIHDPCLDSPPILIKELVLPGVRVLIGSLNGTHNCFKYLAHLLSIKTTSNWLVSVADLINGYAESSDHYLYENQVAQDSSLYQSGLRLVRNERHNINGGGESLEVIRYVFRDAVSVHR